MRRKAPNGRVTLEAYQRALNGIRARLRGEEPTRPEDPFILRDATTVLLDCGLRADERFRLRWEHIRDQAICALSGRLRRPREYSADAAPSCVPGNAARGSEDGRDLPGCNQERSHREIQLQEAIHQSLRAREDRGLRAVHVPPHLPDAVGGIHEPVHSGVSRGTAISPQPGGTLTRRRTQSATPWNGRGRRRVGSKSGTMPKNNWKLPVRKMLRRNETGLGADERT